MKIVFFEVEVWMEEFVRQILPEHELVFTTDALDDTSVEKYADAEIISVFVFSKVSKSVIDKMPNLKMIAARSTGFDHIDISSAKEKNVVVTNVPKYGSVTVAEHTWSLILGLSRNIYTSYERTENNDFSIEGLRGFDLDGKTLGIVGLGEIGKKVVEMSRGFNLKIRIFTRTKEQDFADKFENCVFVDRVEDVFSHSDVISFHAPLTPETKYLLNFKNYKSLKPGSIVVNTSRGALIETKALVRALKEGILRGAGLDVLESESVIKNEVLADTEHLPNESELAETYINHLLMGLNNVIVTPHNAFNSDESIRRLVGRNAENIAMFLAGKNEELDRVGL